LGIDERLVPKLAFRLAVVLLLVFGPRAAIGQESRLRIAMSGSFQPFSTTDPQGRLTGFDADIARALARRMGRSAELIQIDWNGIQAGLQGEKYDLICGSMAITEARRESMEFSLPYYVSGAQVFGVGGREPKSFGVTESSTYARYIREHPERFEDSQVVAYGSEAEILAAIASDKIDGFVSDRIVGGFYLSRSGDLEVKPIGPLLYQEACGIAARRGEDQLVRQVNQALLDLVQSGEYEAIYRKWVGEAPDFKTLFEQWGEHARYLPVEKASTKEQAEPLSGQQSTATAWVLAKGAWLTLQLSLVTALLSMATGLILGLGTVSPRAWLRRLSSSYIWLIRGTPLLVQLFLSYFVVATTVNRLLGFEAMGAFASALLALAVNTTAYNGETLRGGILGVSKGQWDAALSLGMKRAQILRRIVMPQALRASIPSLGNNLVVLVKDTSLVGAITLIELTYAARNVVFQTGQAFTPFFLAAGFYLAIISALSAGVHLWERRLAKP
jgi:His/Glu/Gln/Arg/opine family amino acid ABC transporter permease subunit